MNALIYSYRSIILSLAALNLRLSKSRSRIAALISSSRAETFAHASSRAACYQQQLKTSAWIKKGKYEREYNFEKT